MFAAAPTPPPADTPVTHAPTRPPRRRGLSYLRNLSNSSSSNNQAADSSGNNNPPLTRSISTPDRAIAASTSPNQRLPPAAPSTFLNQSIGYLASLANSSHSDHHSHQHSRGQESGGGSSQSDEEPRSARSMVRRKKTSSGGGSNSNNNAGQYAGGVSSSNGLAASPPPRGGEVEPHSPSSAGLQGLPVDQMPTIKFIPHHDQRSNKPSLTFSATSRTLPHEDCVIRVGRYSERDVNQNPPPNVPSSAPVGFKSKVVSRRHCEFWCSNGQWYIKDVKSSSGTFLNHIRLSQPSVESRPFPVNDGDVVQLGIDFRGGEEQIFRCVKIRVECNRAWQKGLNSFNMSTHKRLRALGAANQDTDNASSHSTATECSICLMSVAPCQALFVAPCSHVWHFKCIRPILNNHKTYPQFMCPNCRAVANLEEEVDDPGAMGNWGDELPIDSASDPEESAIRPVGFENEATPSARTGAGGSERAISDRVPVVAVENTSQPRGHRRTGDDVPHAVEVHDEDYYDDFDDRNLEPAHEISTSSSRVRGIDSTPIPIRRTGSGRQGWNQSIDMPPIPNGTFQPTSPGSDPGREGPLTPRNDAGPFVFDGSAGRDGELSSDRRSLDV